jgi:hypothetical protein
MFIFWARQFTTPKIIISYEKPDAPLTTTEIKYIE